MPPKVVLRDEGDQSLRSAAWHAQSVSESLSGLRSSAGGLSSAEAEARLAAHGPNRLTPVKPRSTLLRLVAQFQNVLIYVLLAAAPSRRRLATGSTAA